MTIKKNVAKKMVIDLLNMADITMNGTEPWDIHIHNEQFYQRILHNPILELGETYMDGWWDSERVDLMIARLLSSKIEAKMKQNIHVTVQLFISKFFNFQTKKRSLAVGLQHYDLSHDLYQIMLGDIMNYSCGYWKHAQTLEQAQIDKMDLSLRKLMLKPGMRLLDVGCGWGEMAKYAAEQYGVSVVGITISQQQYEQAKERCKHSDVDIRFQDYRDLHEKFDRVVSIGMFEHVGHLNYRTYMQTIHQCLTEDGIFLLHSIGGNTSTTFTNPWISKYIFPNSMLPSISQIGHAVENSFIMEDWHNFGMDYYKTLMCWHHNFNAGWNTLKQYYDDRFYRMWNYYLLSSAGSFMARNIQLWQIVLSKNGIQGRYEAAR